MINIILGPTSSGKTTLALKLAKEFDGIIVSADSRQIYKNMDIGTGKIPLDKKVMVQKGSQKWVLDGIDIWGYDLTEPDMYFSAYDYAQFAINKINELLQTNKKIFVVGGTGFYIDILTGKINLEEFSPDFELRKNLEQMTTNELVEKLMSLNLVVYEKIDKQNKMRLIRAIEKEMQNNAPKHNPLPKLNTNIFQYIGLTAPRALLYSKADAWLDYVWDNGLIEETQNLVKQYPTSTKLNGLIYKSVSAYLKNVLPQDEAKQRAKFDLHAYIRRQQTWFKKNEEINWFDITNENYPKNIQNLLK